MARWWFPATTTEQWWLDTDDFEQLVLTPKALIAYDPLRTTERVKLGYGYGETFVHGGGQRVRIAYELGGDEDSYDDHLALVSTLREGREVSFAQNATDAWAVPLESNPARGDTGLNYDTTNVFPAFASITNPVNGTTCIIQSALPELHREVVAISAVNTGFQVITIAGRGSHTGLVYDYTTTDDVDKMPILRPMYFFPFLRLMPGQRGICQQVDGMKYMFDAWFTIDVGFEHQFIGEGD